MCRICYHGEVRQSWRVFRRDVGRLLRVRKAWIIVIGVLVTPALYAWFNINAFWDPYANTGNIRVAVVNLDEGGSSELTGAVDVGAQIEDQLRENRQLGWELRGEDDAQQRLRRGDVYAVITIPADFSKDLLSLTTGTFTQPALRYEVNEKASAITPKITDVGASEIDKKITGAFKEQVALAATEALKNGGDAAELRLLNAKDRSLSAFAEATQTLASVRGKVAGLQNGLASSREDLSSARGTLADLGTTLGDLQASVATLPSILAETQREVLAFSDAATAAFVTGTTPSPRRPRPRAHRSPGSPRRSTRQGCASTRRTRTSLPSSPRTERRSPACRLSPTGRTFLRRPLSGSTRSSPLCRSATRPINACSAS